jgi:tripartite motif-containing protein 33
MEHREHRYKLANEIAKETRDHLQSLLQEISYKKQLLSSAMNVIDDRQAKIAEKKTELSKEIHDLVAKLASAVSSRGKQLLFRLNQVCEHKLEVLNEKKVALQHLSSHTDHCIGFVQNALENGSDGAVLYSKKTLSRHLNKVKCQRADIPNPEIPVRVQLFLSNVPELENGETCLSLASVLIFLTIPFSDLTNWHDPGRWQSLPSSDWSKRLSNSTSSSPPTTKSSPTNGPAG